MSEGTERLIKPEIDQLIARIKSNPDEFASDPLAQSLMAQVTLSTFDQAITALCTIIGELSSSPNTTKQLGEVKDCLQKAGVINSAALSLRQKARAAKRAAEALELKPAKIPSPPDLSELPMARAAHASIWHAIDELKIAVATIAPSDEMTFRLDSVDLHLDELADMIGLNIPGRGMAARKRGWKRT